MYYFNSKDTTLVSAQPGIVKPDRHPRMGWARQYFLREIDVADLTIQG